MWATEGLLLATNVGLVGCGCDGHHHIINIGVPLKHIKFIKQQWVMMIVERGKQQQRKKKEE